MYHLLVLVKATEVFSMRVQQGHCSIPEWRYR